MQDNQFSTSALIIFIRNPEIGKVKTRIAAKTGDAYALEIYKALLEHTREVVLQVDANRLLFYTDSINTKDEWNNSQFTKLVQEGDELGLRMHNAFLTALQKHEKVVIVGSDIASITPDIIEEAFEKLDEHPFVIGPAIDGGYYLLGMKSPAPELFENMVWSTPEVLSDTLSRMESLHESYHLLPTLSDIDYIEDWEKYGWALQNTKVLRKNNLF